VDKQFLSMKQSSSQRSISISQTQPTP